MRRRMSLIFAAFFLLFVSWASASAHGWALALSSRGELAVWSSGLNSEQTQRTFLILAGRNGFNKTAGRFEVQVNEGDHVRITFRYDDTDLNSDNPHIIYIMGYGIETAELSRSNPSDTVEFIAGQPGEFGFYCIIPCIGMTNMQGGVLVVKSSGQARAPTQMDLTADIADAKNGTLNLKAQVRDDRNRPVSGVVVAFYVNTTWGLMKIGTVATDTDGAATLTHEHPVPGKVQFFAIFTGSGLYGQSQASIEVFIEARELSPREPLLPYVLGQNLFIDLRAVGVPAFASTLVFLIVFLIVGSVWMAYAYVLKELVMISRLGKEIERRKTT